MKRQPKLAINIKPARKRRGTAVTKRYDVRPTRWQAIMDIDRVLKSARERGVARVSVTFIEG